MIIKLTRENICLYKTNLFTKEQLEYEYQTNPYAKYLIYIEKNRIIGYLYYSEIYDRIEINQIEIEVSNRNCGKGLKLLKHLTETVNKSISLEVKEDNLPAISIYKKAGFVPKAIRKNYYHGKDGILMVREKQNNFK